MLDQPNQQFRHEFNQLHQEDEVGFDPNQSHAICERSYGNCKILTRKSNGQPQLVLGPHWFIFIFALLVTLTLIVLMLASLKNVLKPFWFYIIIVTSTIYAYSYLRIGFSNPGFAHSDPNSQPNQYTRMCQICKVPKTRDIYHCPDCNVCIQGYDHHCPWIGKCVGAKNLHSFYFFLIMIFGTILLCFVAVISSGSTNQSQTGQPVVMG